MLFELVPGPRHSEEVLLYSRTLALDQIVLEMISNILCLSLSQGASLLVSVTVASFKIRAF